MFWKKTDSSEKKTAIKLYAVCVEMARKPSHYLDFDIRDEILGRFEVLSVFLFVMLRRLKEEKTAEASTVSQKMVELFVEDMDHSLRNARLSEKGIDRNFKRFIEGFFGRLTAYDMALEDDSLDRALYKNVYDSNNDCMSQSSQLGSYVKAQLDHLKIQKNIHELCFI
ncbi:MAG: hypothetical protein KF798_06510 [Candidatus Paracaedibacteraceae bacterium]|nr:hypothetical protein [Candidatus Paracaedibacteraceae bacterium]